MPGGDTEDPSSPLTPSPPSVYIPRSFLEPCTGAGVLIATDFPRCFQQLFEGTPPQVTLLWYLLHMVFITLVISHPKYSCSKPYKCRISALCG